jgi:O-antigen/teichoic acid export membrane protein
MSPPSDPELPPAPPSGSGKGHAPRILHNTGMLAISGLFVRGMGMVMMVILARSLGAEGYGTYQRAEAFVFMFSILGSLGLDMILTREVARRGARAPEYLTGVLILKLLLGPLCFALILGFAYARGYHGEFLWGIWCYSFVLFLTTISQTCDAYLQGLDEMGYIAITNIANQLAFVVLGGACVWLGKDLRWILSALVVAAVIRLVVSTSILTRLRIRFAKPQPGTLTYLLRQSVPIAFAASFVVVYQQLDAVLLGELKGNTQVGWYKAGVKFLLFFTVLRESFLVAIYPVFASVAQRGREHMGTLVTRAVRYQLVVALYFIICFVVLPRVAPTLLGDAFVNTAAILPIMALMLVPQTISITMGRVLVASGNQKRIMAATGVALVVNVGLNLAFIPRFGYMGAAVAGATSEVSVALVSVYYVQRYVARTQILRAILRPAIAAVLAGVTVYLLPGLHLYQALPLAGILYVAGLFALRTFSAVELSQFRTALRAGWVRLRKSGGGAGGGIDSGSSAGA